MKMVILILLISSFVLKVNAQSTYTKTSTKALGIFLDSINFTTVIHVVMGSAADKAGFYSKDKIIKINNSVIQQTNQKDFLNYLNSFPDKISFEVERKNAFLKLDVTKTEKATFLNKCISGDCINGFGVFTDSFYCSYIGEFKDGKRIKGFRTIYNGDAYDGTFVNEKYEGFGEYQLANGAIYKGDWKNGLLNGKGSYISFDKKKSYTGDYFNGKKQGSGNYTIDGTLTYNGEFYNDKYYGKGILIVQNKYKYDGEFKDNKKHGKGRMTIFQNGKTNETYDGIWENDELISKSSVNSSDSKPKTRLVKMNVNMELGDNVFLGTLLLHAGNSVGVYILSSYGIYGKKGATLNAKDIEIMEKLLNFKLSNGETNEKYRNRVFKRTFNKNIEEEELINKILKNPKEYGISGRFTDRDILKHGNYLIIND